MEIIVFAERFEHGMWGVWEHKCSEEELAAVEDSARAKAQNRLSFGPPLPADYLEGARYIFDVAFGPKDNPRDGDTRVNGVCVDGVVVGVLRKISRHLANPGAAA